MAKNPVKGFTMAELERSTGRAEKKMIENAEILNKRNPETNGPNYESTDPQRWAGDDGYDDSVEKTDSPLYAYVSTAGHFQRMQDNIASAFTPTKGGKGVFDSTKENEEDLRAEEKTAASKVITGDGFGNRSGSKPIEIEDIDVYDESDLEFDNQ